MRGITQPRVLWHARKPIVNSTLKKPFGRVLYTTINVDRLSVDSLSWLLVVSQSAAGWCSRPIGQFTLTRQRQACTHCSDAGDPWSGQLLSAQCPWLACKTPCRLAACRCASGRQVHTGSGCPPNCPPSSASDQCSIHFSGQPPARQHTHRC